MGLCTKIYILLKNAPGLPSSRRVVPNTNSILYDSSSVNHYSSWVVSEGRIAPYNSPGWQHWPCTFRWLFCSRCRVWEILPVGTLDHAPNLAREGEWKGRGNSYSQVALGLLAVSPLFILHDRGQAPIPSPVTASGMHSLALGMQVIYYLVGRDFFKHLYLCALFLFYQP